MEILKIFCSLSEKGINYSTYKMVVEETDRCFIDHIKKKRVLKTKMMIPETNLRNMLPGNMIGYYVYCPKPDKEVAKGLVKAAVLSRFEDIRHCITKLERAI